MIEFDGIAAQMSGMRGKNGCNEAQNHAVYLFNVCMIKPLARIGTKTIENE